MSEQDTFGPRLRRERERRGITLETIVTRTNVSLELWQGFESNDFSRWPTRLYARAFVRDYAKAIGLDPDEIVDDFCRLFPLGDRRSVPVIRAQAELIGHETTAKDDPRLIPDGIDRRANPDAPAERPAPRRRLVPRILGAIFHTHS
jgi:transcriptional regulator with XRE-family HTH domain